MELLLPGVCSNRGINVALSSIFINEPTPILSFLQSLLFFKDGVPTMTFLDSGLEMDLSLANPYIANVSRLRPSLDVRMGPQYAGYAFFSSHVTRQSSLEGIKQ